MTTTGTLPLKYNLADGETFVVKVFRDDPAWDAHSRWFNLPMGLLEQLFVCRYECDCQAHLDWIEKEHPGCVFVY